MRRPGELGSGKVKLECREIGRITEFDLSPHPAPPPAPAPNHGLHRNLPLPPRQDPPRQRRLQPHRTLVRGSTPLRLHPFGGRDRSEAPHLWHGYALAGHLLQRTQPRLHPAPFPTRNALSPQSLVTSSHHPLRPNHHLLHPRPPPPHPQPQPAPHRVPSRDHCGISTASRRLPSRHLPVPYRG